MDLSAGCQPRVVVANNHERPGRAQEARFVMTATHLALNYHVVFGTKQCRPLILGAWRHRLHALIGGCVREAGGVALAIGGVAGHAHLLLGLKATHRLCDVVREIKAASSRWVHQQIKEPDFAWQEGYGAFTVSASQLDTIRAYIAKQEVHHAKVTFRDEYRSFLERHGVSFDPSYLE